MGFFRTRNTYSILDSRLSFLNANLILLVSNLRDSLFDLCKKVMKTLLLGLCLGFANVSLQSRIEQS